MADLKTTKEARAEMRDLILMPASNYIANLTDDLDTLEAENEALRAVAAVAGNIATNDYGFLPDALHADIDAVRHALSKVKP